MVPRIASRGGSFQGAGMYYLHDKQADTSDRVAWTETLNLPTNDPNKAMNWMAYTAMSADELKRSSGVKATGRKAQKGSVYSYSLAWHPDQSPEEQHMKLQAKSTLELLGLKDHEAVVVAHQETDHDHVHVIVNLIHPESGKTAKVYKDHIKLSEWAEAYEKKHGHIYCEKRVENNKNRGLENDNLKKTQYKEEQLKRAKIVHDLYTRSDSGKAFQAAMKEQGFDLTAGKRRAFSFVDEQGKIHSLSRHINLVVDKDQNPTWRSDMKARLASADLADATMVATQREEEWAKQQHFDRDEYHAEQQIKIDQAGIDADQKQKYQSKGEKRKSKAAVPYENKHKDALANEIISDRSEKEDLKQAESSSFDLNKAQDLYWMNVDKWSKSSTRQRFELENKLKDIYEREGHLKRIQEIKEQMKSSGGILGKVTGKKQKLLNALEAEQNTLLNINMRIQEEKERLEKLIDSKKPIHYLEGSEFDEKTKQDSSSDFTDNFSANRDHSAPDYNEPSIDPLEP